MTIVETLVRQWPEHESYVRKSMESRSADVLANSERWAGRILTVIGKSSKSLPEFCSDYQFLCGRVLEEEIYFRRNGRYRLSKFEDAVAEVYSNRDFMDKYMNFLLLSHVLWDNHARAMMQFETTYLPALPPSTNHLEIGPGHGLLLACAAEASNVAAATGWDVSETSISQTRRCLDAMGVSRPVDLRLQDLFDAPPPSGDRFGSVVLAEVLEHLEDPVAALQSIRRHMTPDGQVWIHVPLNSPAPDHLYLLRTPDETLDMVRRGGFEVVRADFYPMTGATLERALKHSLTISAVVTARNQQ